MSICLLCMPIKFQLYECPPLLLTHCCEINELLDIIYIYIDSCMYVQFRFLIDYLPKKKAKVKENTEDLFFSCYLGISVSQQCRRGYLTGPAEITPFSCLC